MPRVETLKEGDADKDGTEVKLEMEELEEVPDMEGEEVPQVEGEEVCKEESVLVAVGVGVTKEVPVPLADTVKVPKLEGVPRVVGEDVALGAVVCVTQLEGEGVTLLALPTTVLLDTPVSEARTYDGVGREDCVQEAVKEAPGVPLSAGRRVNT